MVAFAGRKYAARSLPAFVANSTYIVTSFTLVRTFPLLLLHFPKYFIHPHVQLNDHYCNAGSGI